MTEEKDITYFEQKLLEFQDEEDPVCSMLSWVTEQLMEIEVSHRTGVVKGKHSGDRKTSRSGYRSRRWDTRVGTVFLSVPKVRDGGYIPFFLTERKRSEQALVEVVREAWVNGVSTRKIDRLAKTLGIESISASQVSGISKGLDGMVGQFRTRPLQEEYPVLWVDALYEKVRESDRVVSTAVLVVKGVDLQGNVHILSVEPMAQESEGTYLELFRDLKERGVRKVWLVVSDAHQGLRKAIDASFLGASWQRCKVHFMRNILSHVGQTQKKRFAERLEQIWLQPEKKDAASYALSLEAEYGNIYPEAVRCLMEGLEDSLQFYGLPLLDSRKTASNNSQERLNREIRRRTRVVGVFPGRMSYLRLVVTYLMEYEDDCQSERCYLSAKAIMEQKRLLECAA
jgi:transposase-like protein